MPTFPLSLHWRGSTAAEYSRDAAVHAPAKASVMTSAGGAYGGDATRWNPEELFGASVAMCHLLTFLALAHKVRLDVRAVEDDVEVTLDSVDGVTRVTRVTLRPAIAVAPGTDVAKTRAIYEKAHKYCFIGNSITSEVVMEPRVVETS